MKTWISPTLSELEIRLTAKNPGNVERIASWGTSGDWLTSTYAQDTPTPPGSANLS